MCCASGTEARRWRTKISAGLRVELGEIRAPRKRNITLHDLRKAEVMKNFGDRKQVVDFQLQIAREVRQVGLAVVGRRRNGLDQTENHVGRNRRQSDAELQLGQRLGGSEGWAGRHPGVNVIHHLPEGFVKARMRKDDFDFTRPPGVRGKIRIRSHMKTASSMCG
jgi:hypothetical protein